jgi:hypothetical protein
VSVFFSFRFSLFFVWLYKFIVFFVDRDLTRELSLAAQNYKAVQPIKEEVTGFFFSFLLSLIFDVVFFSFLFFLVFRVRRPTLSLSAYHLHYEQDGTRVEQMLDLLPPLPEEPEEERKTMGGFLFFLFFFFLCCFFSSHLLFCFDKL